MLVREVLKIKGDRLISVTPTTTLRDAITLMVANDIGSLVVMQAQDMAGMLTFREVLSAVHSEGQGAMDRPVRDFMVKNPACAKPEDTVDQMRTVMTEQHVRYLPIKDGAKLLGVLSFHDVAKAALKAASFENKLLKSYIRNWPEAQTAASDQAANLG